MPTLAWPPSTDSPPPTQANPRRRHLALVVDDDPGVRALEADILDVAGWRTLTARDGEGALRQIHEQAPDVVLLDVALPRMSGLDVLRQLRSDAWRGPRPRVVLVSGYAALLAPETAGLADAVVAKPFEVEVLLRAVEPFALRLT